MGTRSLFNLIKMGCYSQLTKVTTHSRIILRRKLQAFLRGLTLTMGNASDVNTRFASNAGCRTISGRTVKHS
jgi:hypothetical protein